MCSSNNLTNDVDILETSENSEEETESEEEKLKLTQINQNNNLLDTKKVYYIFSAIKVVNSLVFNLHLAIGIPSKTKKYT